MKGTLLLLFIFIYTGFAYSQNGTLKGKVLNSETGESVPFASVAITQGGKQFGGAVADVDGNYTIKPIPPGRYDLKASHLEFNSITIQNVVIPPDQITFINIKMLSKVTKLKVVEIVQYKVPLISKDQTQSGQVMTSEEIAKMPERSAESAASLVGGVSADENGHIGGIRGQRADATVYYIDGVRVTGSYSLPQSAIDQVSVITGGLPAQYGDATGGIINITTKGPSRTFGGGIHLQSSQLTDKYGYNMLEFNLQGPLLKKRKDTTGKSARIGFFISGNVSSVKDPNPFYGGYYKVNDDALNNLQAHPLTTVGAGDGVYMSSEYVGKNNVEKIRSKQNAGVKGFNVSGKIDVKTTNRSNLMFGGSMDFNKEHSFQYNYAFLDPEHFPLVTDNTWRVFGQYTHRFNNKDSKSLIKNAYYSVQVNYSKFKETVEDPVHKNNFFDYGYVGKYTTHKVKSYELGSDSKLGYNNVYIHNGFADTLVEFQRSDINPYLSNYTQAYYNMHDLNSGYYKNLDIIRSNRAQLANGDIPPNVYDIWANTGTPYTNYSVRNNSVFEFNVNGSADIKNHAIQFGFQFQRDERRYFSCSPVQLWQRMRQLANKQIEQRDMSNPHRVMDANGVFQDTIWYDRKYSATDQSTFDYNLRKSLGLPSDGLEWIDVDSYDPQKKTMNYISPDDKIHTAVLSNDLSLDMFNALELLNGGQPFVNYWGYDYAGNAYHTKDLLGTSTVKTSNIDAYRPMYMAGYIQDKFAFNDLIFNIGLRFDRFDANQQVLKDPFLLSEAKTVEQTRNEFSHPSNMGDNYVVYVDDMVHPTQVMGYRSGYTWYNATGAEISDPTLISSAQGIQPYLVDPSQHFSVNAFTNYKPQVNLMPRIAFSFPISDDALFFAHYDILTRRPSYFQSVLNPISYYLLETSSGDEVISNPNLKPEKTIDYELGFQQKVTKTSSVKLSGYYREIRDQINVYRYYGAYPKSYMSYDNRDYTTVKGLTVSYDLRHTGNIWLKANYTLQFADGTGSSPTSAQALIASGQPNLRVYTPLAYDRCHEIKTIIDFRFGDKSDYNGPKITLHKKGDKEKTLLLLENTGINFTFWAGSGNPYTAKSMDGTTFANGNLSGGNTIGSPYGARLPWQFRIDARLDKDFVIKSGRTKKKDIIINIYVQMLNVLNLKNVMYVYPTTGNPDDNGYLSSPQYASQINVQTNPAAYRQQYAMYINNPYNYSLPRQTRLGIEIKF